MVNKIIIASAFYNRSAAVPAFWEGFDNATLDAMPKALQEGFLAVNNNQAALQNMFNKDVQRMKTFKGWSDEQIQSIQAPALILNGNNDVGSLEHAVQMHRLIPDSVLVVLPGGHGEYLGETGALQGGKWTQTYTVDIIEEFLNK